MASKDKGNNKKGYALVTGATSGIGYEFAKLLASEGYDLVIVARMQDRLEEVSNELSTEYGRDVITISKDLFNPSSAREIYQEVNARDIKIQLLINDAGQGEYGKFVDIDLERDVEIINLNIISLVALTKYFLRDMLARNEGRILQLASVVGKIPSPLMAVYSGTKSFVITFTQSLIEEIKDSKVTVTALLPGATDTDFFHKAHQDDSQLYREGSLADPSQVAKDGYKALMDGESKIVSGMKNKMQIAMAAIMPDETLAKQMHKQVQPSDKSPQEGRTRSSHPASDEEREEIAQETQSNNGDLATEK